MSEHATSAASRARPLRLALLGYGRMGRLVGVLAKRQGHEVLGHASSTSPLSSDKLRQADVAIEFSVPTAAEALCRRALALGVPVVSGSTGWPVEGLRAEVVDALLPAFLHATNMSVGVNALFAANELVAQVLAKAEAADPSYRVKASIEETHHIHKLDRPSGTAITLAEPLRLDEPIISHRRGEVLGEHTVAVQTPHDLLTLAHAAQSREGFASGALLAAAYVARCGRGQTPTMRDVLGIGV